MENGVYFLIPIIYAAINSVSFVLYGLDKFKAKRQKWRISEQTLLVAAFFGPIGAWMGMQRFRHKTQKPLFKFLVPLFLGIHVMYVLWINL